MLLACVQAGRRLAIVVEGRDNKARRLSGDGGGTEARGSGGQGN